MRPSSTALGSIAFSPFLETLPDTRSMHRFSRQELDFRGNAAFGSTRSVRFQDVDAAGIVFYPRVLEYFHDAYVEFLARHGEPLPVVLAERRWAAPLRHAEADYFRPLRFGDSIEVALVRAHVEPTQITVGYRVENLGTKEVAAVGQTVHSFVILPSFERCPVPRALADALSGLGAGAPSTP
ncbi:MAG TPA: thioesterase family protein [Polyangiaceae bacterium]